MVSPHNRIQSAPTRRRPMSPLVPLIVIVGLLVGGLFLLAGVAKEQPMRVIEVDVAHDAATK